MWCEIKGWKFLWCTYMIYLMNYMVCIYVCLTISSPYMLVFGDDRILSTHKQGMLQVDLVRHRSGVGLVWDKEFHQSFYIFYDFK